MKRSGLGLGVLVVSLTSLSAQVLVEVTQEQEQYLPGEAVPLAVRIINRSGRVLHLGADPDWLTFSVDAKDAPVVPKLGEVPVTGEFKLESSKVAIKRVDLAPYFSLTMPGRFSVIATVRVKEWDQQISSPAKNFEIVRGTELFTRDVGVPLPAGATNSFPEMRTYTLTQANYVRGQFRLYLRVTDKSGRIVRVAPIGPLISFSRPEAQVDKSSNLHVLYQAGPNSFSYTAFNTLGELVARQTYEYDQARPRLWSDDDGTISIRGGIRRPSAKDVPKEEQATPATAETNALPADAENKPAKP